MSLELLPDEIERYSRQLLLKNWGAREQTRLKEIRGLISVRAEVLLRYLVGAGVGRIALFGSDKNSELLRSLSALNNSPHVSEEAEGTYDFFAIFPDEIMQIPERLVAVPRFEIPTRSPAGFPTSYPFPSAQARVAKEILYRFALRGA